MKKLLLFALGTFNVALSSYEEVIPLLKGTYEPFLREPLAAHKGLSPIMGAVAWHSGWIAGLHKWGASRFEKIRESDKRKFMVLSKDANATVSLVDELFQNINDDLMPTHTTHPLYLLIKYDEDGALLKEFLTLLKTGGVGSASPARTAVVAHIAMFIADKGGAEKKNIQRNFNAFFNHIQQSLDECGVDKRYPEQTTQQIIAAYWYAVQFRSEVRLPEVPLKEHMQRALERYMHALGDADYHVQEYSAEQVQEMLFQEDVVIEADVAQDEVVVEDEPVAVEESAPLSPTTPHDVATGAVAESLSIEIVEQEGELAPVLEEPPLSPITPRSPDAVSDVSVSFASLSTDALEQLLVGVVLNAAAVARYPAAAQMGSYGYRGKKRVANCVETMLQNFFNLLLFDKATQQYSLAALPPALKTSDRLRAFYSSVENMVVANANEGRVQQAWMDTVSGLSGVNYVNGDYEVRSEPDNVLRVLNTLLGAAAASFEDLGALLSTPVQTVTLTTRPTSDGFEFIAARGDEKITATFHIDSGHAHAQFPQKFIDDCYRGEWGYSAWHPYENLQIHLFFTTDCFLDEDIPLTSQQWSFLSYSVGTSNIERLLFFETRAVASACKNADDACQAQIKHFAELLGRVPLDQPSVQTILVQNALEKKLFERLPVEVRDRIVHMPNIDEYAVRWSDNETIGAFAGVLNLVTKGRQYWNTAREENNVNMMRYLEEHGVVVPMPTRLRFAAYHDQFSHDGDDTPHYFDWLVQSNKDAVRKAFTYALKISTIVQLIKNAGDAFDYDLLKDISEKKLLALAKRLMDVEQFKNWFARNHPNLLGQFDLPDYEINSLYAVLNPAQRELFLKYASQDKKDYLLKNFLYASSPEAVVALRNGAHVDDEMIYFLAQLSTKLDPAQRKELLAHLSIEQKNAMMPNLLTPEGYPMIFDLMSQDVAFPRANNYLLVPFYLSLNHEQQELFWGYLSSEQKDYVLSDFLRTGSIDNVMFALQHGAHFGSTAQYSLTELFKKLDVAQRTQLYPYLDAEQKQSLLSDCLFISKNYPVVFELISHGAVPPDNAAYTFSEIYSSLRPEQRELLLTHLPQKQKDFLLENFLRVKDSNVLTLLQRGAHFTDMAQYSLRGAYEKFDAQQRAELLTYLNDEQKILVTAHD